MTRKSLNDLFVSIIGIKKYKRLNLKGNNILLGKLEFRTKKEIYLSKKFIKTIIYLSQKTLAQKKLSSLRLLSDFVSMKLNRRMTSTMSRQESFFYFKSKKIHCIFKIFKKIIQGLFFLMKSRFINSNLPFQINMNMNFTFDNLMENIEQENQEIVYLAETMVTGSKNLDKINNFFSFFLNRISCGLKSTIYTILNYDKKNFKSTTCIIIREKKLFERYLKCFHLDHIINIIFLEKKNII
jgi:hypothetical protein